jgi:hypothetical protein
MKKIAFALLALGFSVQAFAGTLDQGARTIVEDDDCALLSEGVAATLSANVQGAYSCNTTTNLIAITTCHPNGRKDASGNNNFYTASGAGGGIASEQTAGCDAVAAEGIANTASAAELDTPATPETPAN